MNRIYQMRFTACRAVLATFLLGVYLVSAPVFAQSRASAAWQHRQRDQERARVMASELVASVLDIQLRQLAENNLQTLPIYGEIKSMQANLYQLVEREMQDVVRLLVQGQRANEQDRERIALEARGKVRSVVGALMAERQKLAKRMHLARLAAQGLLSPMAASVE